MEAQMLGCGKILLPLALMMAAPVATMAQTTDNPPAQTGQTAQPAPSQPAAQAPANPAPAQPQAELLKPEQLEALVAPIALYPDELLANVLAASTYPLEVVQADRWIKGNKNLKGDALKSAVDKQAWDDSVKALVSTPDVITMMSDKIDWTKDLGDAVLAQQADVMDAVQRLRAKAQARNKLVTNKQQKVSVQKQDNRDVIVIQQAQPDTMYVPYYEPATVYGEWPYTEYPPYYFGYPSYIGAGVIAAGLAFGTAWAIGRWGNYWGGGCNWGNRNVYVNHRTNNINWQHNSAHRQGVKYANQNVANRFGGNVGNKAGVSDRMDFRGRDGQQVLKPGDRAGDRAGDRGGDRAGDRAGDRGGDRAGNRGGDRAGAGDRAKGGGDRAKGGGGDRAKSAKGGGGGNRAAAANRGGSRGGGNAFSGAGGGGRAANFASARGQMSMGGRGGGAAFAGGGRGGGGGFAMGGGGRGGGGFGGGGRGGGGGRRSDIALKHDVVLLGHLGNGLGYYRFSYLGSHEAYVGVMAQEVQAVMPGAVTRGGDGYLRVHYDRLGLKFRTWRDWLAAGGQIPTGSRI
jgi:hypothetical protein